MKHTVLAILGALVVFGPVVYAHHSHPDFLLDQDASVEGIIESIRFQSPHVLITVRTADWTLYTAEWQAAHYLKGHPELVTPPEIGPMNSDTLKVGDPVVVVGCPPRDPTRHELVNLKEVRRLVDEWLWTCRRPDRRIWC
jgi:hypothetical protein